MHLFSIIFNRWIMDLDDYAPKLNFTKSLLKFLKIKNLYRLFLLKNNVPKQKTPYGGHSKGLKVLLLCGHTIPSACGQVL